MVFHHLLLLDHTRFLNCESHVYKKLHNFLIVGLELEQVGFCLNELVDVIPMKDHSRQLVSSGFE